MHWVIYCKATRLRLICPLRTKQPTQNEIRSYNKRKIPVVFILTSNVAEEYDVQLLNRYKIFIENFIGPTKTLISGNTLQINDYEKYNWTMFNPEEKRERREKIFPTERRNAFTLGADMVK